MAYEPGIVTRVVTVGGSSSAEAALDLELVAKVSAVAMCEDGSTRPVLLIWEATGWRYESSPHTVTGAAGEAVSLPPLPVSDQSGWRDGETGFLLDVSTPGTHTHLYEIELVTKRGWGEVSRRIIGPFALPTGDGSPVDADLLIEADTVPGLLVSVPDALTPRMDALEDEVDTFATAIPAAVEDYLTANPPTAEADHGALAGLADDDHPQYHTDARGDARYSPLGHNHTGTYAPALGADDNYVTDAEKAALHTHPAVIAQGATAADARAAIGAGTSSFSGAYADLSGKPTIPDTEAIQDVVGAMVAAAGGTYNDAGGSITLPAGGGGSTSVQFVAERSGITSPTLAANAFTTYPLNTVTANIGGGTWDPATFIYTVPVSGLYLCLGGIRLLDSQASRSVAVGIGTVSADAGHVLWDGMGGTGADSRSGRQYARLTRFNAGDGVRMYIYSDGATFACHGITAGAPAAGQFMSLIKLAD